jgi:hypothetical protein
VPASDGSVTRCQEGSGNVHIPRGGAALGIPAEAQLNRPLREPSGQLPSASKAMSTRRDDGQRGMQPHTCGTVSPRGGAAPWLRAVQPKISRAGQVFHAGCGADADASTGGCAGSGGGADGCGGALAPPPPAMLGGGALTPEMNQARFCVPHVYATEPQFPYEHVFPGVAQARPWGGASFGQPSVRTA